MKPTSKNRMVTKTISQGGRRIEEADLRVDVGPAVLIIRELSLVRWCMIEVNKREWTKYCMRERFICGLICAEVQIYSCKTNIVTMYSS